MLPYFPADDYPEWHVVDAGNGAFYFFNSETNETSWYPPHLTESALEQARSLKNKEEYGHLMEERLVYTQRLQHQLVSK